MGLITIFKVVSELCVCVSAHTQSYLMLCDCMDCSLLGSSVHGIFQARILEWLPLPSPWNLPCPGTEPRSPVSLTLAGALLPLYHLGSPKSHYFLVILYFADIHALGGIYSNPISMIEIQLINSTRYLPPPSYLVMSSWSPQMARRGIFTPQKGVSYCFVFFFFCVNLRKCW